MNYRSRMTVAAAVSLLINALMFHFLIPGAPRQSLALTQPHRQPVLLNIVPEEHLIPQLVQPQEESDTPPDISDRIAEFDARALDEILHLGEFEGPRFEEEAPLDSLPAPDSAFVEQLEPGDADDAEETEAAEDAAPQLLPIEPEPEPPVMPQEATTEPMQVAARPTPLPVPPTPPQRQEETAEPDEMAETRNAPAPQLRTPPPSMPQPSRGRLHGSVKDKGFMNYAALEHELAPYLEEIRSRVRREWYTLLLTRYSGTTRTSAELEISINADGRLTLNKVVNNNNDPVFAAICQEAIRRAAPFPAFTFEVPDIYRNKDLAIHWTFNFL